MGGGTGTRNGHSSSHLAAEIFARLDIMAECAALGIRFDADAPRASGKVACYAAFRDEAHPSAWIDTVAGQYGDSGSGERAISIFELAARLAPARFPDWKAARRFYAERAGIPVEEGRAARRKPVDLQAVFEWLDWTEGNKRLVTLWCARSKLGTSLEAVIAAGGRVGHYPCYTAKKDAADGSYKKGEKVRGKFKVVALPVYHVPTAGSAVAASGEFPVIGWVIWNITGQPLEIYRGKDKPPELVKMQTIGSASGLMGLAGLQAIVSGAATKVRKTEGPTDLLALVTALASGGTECGLSVGTKSLQEIESAAVICNAGGATQDVPPSVVSLLSGLPVSIHHDADEAGEAGAAKWGTALAAVCETRHVRLPYPVEKKHGRDLRDFLQDPERGGFAELLALEAATPLYVVTPPDAAGQQEGAEAEPGPTEPTANPAAPTKKHLPITNARVERIGDQSSTEPIPLASIVSAIRQATDDWPRRCGGSLFVHESGEKTNEIHWLPSAPALFAWLQSRLGVIDWHRSTGCATKEEVFQALLQSATAHLAIEHLPHHPLLPGHYYAHGPLSNKTSEASEANGANGASGASGNGVAAAPGHALDTLLDYFTPDTELDRDLIRAMFATAFWGGPGGSRPMFAVTSDQGRGIGKSKLTDALSWLAGGSIDLQQGEDPGVLRQRLLSPEGMTRRLARIDNVKSPKFSWAELESLITAPTVSGKRLYYGEASRPNSITWLVTLNGPSLSTDIAQRTVLIKLRRPTRSGSWEEDLASYIAAHRWQIVSDILFWLQTPQLQTPPATRWAAWESAVLSRLPDPGAAQQLIVERQAEADTEVEEAESVECFFREQLTELGYQPDHDNVFIPNAIAAGWFNQSMGERRNTVWASRALHQLCSEGKLYSIRPQRSSAQRGYVWLPVTQTNFDYVFRDLKQRIDRTKDF